MPFFLFALLLTSEPMPAQLDHAWVDVLEEHLPERAVPMFCERVDGEIARLEREAARASEAETAEGNRRRVSELRFARLDYCSEGGEMLWGESEEEHHGRAGGG